MSTASSQFSGEFHGIHLHRSAQEGIVFSVKYGIDIMKEMVMDIRVILVNSEDKGSRSRRFPQMMEQTLHGNPGKGLSMGRRFNSCFSL